MTTTSRGNSKLDTSDPLGFFTNLSARLLQSELGLKLGRIQVWPTNHYSPAVHRLLQVSANILDSTTNRFNDSYPYLPSVFRPRFTNDGQTIYICGYEEAGPAALTNVWRDLNDPADRDALQEGDYVHGIPVVIGAKKGFPNFNEFAMQSVFQITRRLQLTRPSVSAPRSTWQTNQVFIMGISNILGVELWNSYRSNYPRTMHIVVENNIAMQLTNDTGFVLTTSVNLPVSLSVPSNAWTGYNALASDPSFQVPLLTNVVFLPDAGYQSDLPQFTTNLNLAWDTSQTFPLPHWGLAITNRLRLFMVDHETQRLLNFLTLPELSGRRDLSEEIRDPDDALGFNGLWSTNRVNGTFPIGILNQIEISLGNLGGYAANCPPRTPNRVSQVPAGSFRARCLLSPRGVRSVRRVVASRPMLASPFPAGWPLPLLCNEAEPSSRDATARAFAFPSLNGRDRSHPLRSRLHDFRPIIMINSSQLTRTSQACLALSGKLRRRCDKRQP
ncbi:MAG: hypothetical protein KIS67_28450 [Verrucomicrobiae bacterium]|nr:hypothetical protein [Verrucomicrobiae bacterium]